MAVKKTTYVAPKYLEPTDPGAFQDMKVKDQPVKSFPGWTELCPECKGHGGWNMLLNEYGKGKHFQASCGACWGWGWHTPGECAHKWDGKRKNVGNCLNVWTCSKCGLEREVDSSG